MNLNINFDRDRQMLRERIERRITVIDDPKTNGDYWYMDDAPKLLELLDAYEKQNDEIHRLLWKVT